jgi:hypothetical protein
MEEKKRPWSNLLCAAIWSVLLWMKLDTYTDLLSVHNKIFSHERWQQLQMEYTMMFCSYVCLILVFLLRFFLYNRKSALLWSEAATLTAFSLPTTFGILLSSGKTGITYFVLLILWCFAFFEWYRVWRHYHPK